MRNTLRLLSPAYRAGLQAGFKLATRKNLFWRYALPGVLLSAFLSTCMLGAGAGFLYAGAEVFYQTATGESVHRVIVTKFEAWNKVFRFPAPREAFAAERRN